MYILYHNGNKYTIKDNDNNVVYLADRVIEPYYDTYKIFFYSRDNKLLYSIYQKSGIKKILSNTILLSIFFNNAYSLIESDVETGKLIREKACYKIEHNGIYNVRVHTASYVSLWRNDVQIGLMKKKNGKYFILLDEENSNHKDFELCMFVFATCVFLRVVSANHGYCIVPNDKYSYAVDFCISNGESLK